jgi:acyl carrier protein
LLADGAEAAALPPAMRATELQLQQILQSALSLTTMNPDDNFFELGAHSLLLARLETEIRSRVSPKVALLDLFRFPTLRSLARFIVTSEAPPAAPAPSARPERAPGREALRQSRERHRNRPA